MRLLLSIVFILQVSIVTAQGTGKQSYTLNQALQTAFRGIPGVSSENDKKKLLFEIKSTWYSWMYNIQKGLTLQAYCSSMADVDRIASLRYHAGETGFYETSALLLKVAEVKAKTVLIENEIEINHNRLRQLLYEVDTIVPADTNLSIYEVDKGFQANDTNATVDSALARYQEFVHDITVENRMLELDNLFIQLQFFYNYSIPFAETVIRTSERRYKSEEIDYLEMIEKIGEAFEIKLEYLDILNRYNQSAIQLENYAY